MPRHSRKWGKKYTRRICAACGSCMGRYPNDGSSPGIQKSHGICPLCGPQLYGRYWYDTPAEMPETPETGEPK